MDPKTFRRSFNFDEKDTCKDDWNFLLSDGMDGLVIEELEITPHTTADGGARGCNGHPMTIVALVRGLPVESIDIPALTQAGCSRNLACGQALARCLEELKAEFLDKQ